MSSDSDDGSRAQDRADFVGCGVDSGNHDVGKPLIKRAIVPEVGFAAADAGVAGADGERNAVVPLDGGTRVVRCWPAAAHLIQAPALASPVIVPSLDELASIEERAPVALVVNALPIKHFWTANAIEFRQRVEREDVGKNSSHDLGDWRAAGNIDDGLIGDDLMDWLRSGGIRMRGLHAACGGARAPRHDSFRVRRRLPENVLERFASDGAVHSAVFRWSIAFDREQVPARMIFHHVLTNFFRLKACGCLQRVVVVQRDHVEDDVLGNGMGRTDEGLATARALQPVQPQHGNPRFILHGRDDPGHYRGFQSHGGGGGNAEANEVAAIHTMLTEDVVSRGKRLVTGEPPETLRAL